jgi:hypothetical protein
VLSAQEVSVRLAGGNLQLSAPGFRFLDGKPLERLKNGATVPFDIQVSVLADGKMVVLRRSFERFVFSYDLWEEKFSVARMRTSEATASHLSASAAEAWCLSKFSIPTAGIPDDRAFVVRVEVRAANGRDPGSRDDDEGFSITTLIDLFSRPARQHGDSQWRTESRVLRIAELRRDGSR